MAVCKLAATDVTELVAGLPLGIELEPYRARLTPLATAVLQGESRRTIDKRRNRVLAEVWDAPLRNAVVEAIAKLRAELERKLGVLELAQVDVDRPASEGKLAPQVVDRVLADLLAAHDKNLDALEELERALEALPVVDRAARAAAAARGAYVAARIPQNEVRAAIVRTARATERYGLQNDGAFEHAAVFVAETLATHERRRAVRSWARMLADASADHVPLLAGELRALALESEMSDAASDLIWIQACIGLTLEEGMALS